MWAPSANSVAVVFEDSQEAVALASEGNGYFSGCSGKCRSRVALQIQMDGGEAYPDPASRFQPSGPHGYSQDR